MIGSIVLASATACSPALTSPGARGLHLASPATAGAGQTTLTGAIGAGAEAFGPGVVVADAQVRHGVHERVDVGVSGSAAVLVGEELADPPHRGIYAMRAFVHHELVPGWVAVHAGLGGGGSAAGGYLSPDVGLTLGYENPHAVPYLHGSFLGSIPLTRNTLDVRLVDGTEPDPRRAFSTLGTQFGTGVRIPLGPRQAPVGSLFFELSMHLLAGDDPYENDGVDVERFVALVGVGYQHRFGRARSLGLR